MSLQNLLKKISLIGIGLFLIITIFLYVTTPGKNFRLLLAETIITTRYQEYVWVFVGKAKGNELIEKFYSNLEF
ncbi:hypothetical protein AB4Z22_06010 [Paenibacillus sp. TAF58]